MSFDEQVNRARATVAAADAPRFLRRDSDLHPEKYPSGVADSVQKPSYHRAISDLIYELDTQREAINALLDRLAPLLEDSQDDPRPGTVPPPHYSTSPLVQGVAEQVQRLRVHNTQLRDIFDRLAI